MAKLVMVPKPGGGYALVRRGGKLVTDADGAPCCCGGPPPGECPTYPHVCDGQAPFDLGSHFRVTVSASMSASWFQLSLLHTGNFSNSPGYRESTGSVQFSPINYTADVIRCGQRWIASFGPTIFTTMTGEQESYFWDWDDPRPSSPTTSGTANWQPPPGVMDENPNNQGTAIPPIQCRPNPKWRDITGDPSTIYAASRPYTDDSNVVGYMGCRSEMVDRCTPLIGEDFGPQLNIFPPAGTGVWGQYPILGVQPFVKTGIPQFYQNTFNEFSIGINSVQFTRAASSVTRIYSLQWSKSLTWGITVAQAGTRYPTTIVPKEISEAWNATVSITWARISPCGSNRDGSDRLPLPDFIDPDTLQPRRQPGKCYGCGQ